MLKIICIFVLFIINIIYMGINIRNLDEHKKAKWIYFIRFLKEIDSNAYSFFIEEGFKRRYDQYVIYTICSKKDIISYDTYVYNSLNKIPISLIFEFLLNIRNAWYNNLTVNIDWKIVEELWFYEIIENKNNLFNSDDIYHAMRKLNNRYSLFK